MNLRHLSIAMFLFAAVASPASSVPQRRPAKPDPVARAKQENQFITVEDFRNAGRAPKTAVSVEGYVVLAQRMADGGLLLVLVDSVDHVLSAKDADATARSGAAAVLPAAYVKKRPGWGWTPKAMQRFAMYTGAGRAQKNLHDVVVKLRLTGFVRAGTTVNPVTSVEFMDESGNWKPIR